MDLGPLQGVAEIYVGLLAATILFLATNAGLIGVSRLVYSMGIHRQMPDALRQLHPKYQTPWIGILLFGGLAILALLPGPGRLPRRPVLVRRAAVVHHRARLRRAPAQDAARQAAARTAGRATSRIRGYDAPLFAIVGGTFTFVAFVVIMRPQPRSWLRRASAGCCSASLIYVPFRRSRGLDLTTTHKVAIPQPVVDHEAEYDSVLVALNAEEGYNAAPRRDRGQARRAAPARHPRARDDPGPVRAGGRRDACPTPRRTADSIIEQARVQGGRRVTGHWEKVRAGPGRAADHRGGRGHARVGDRDRAAAPRRGRRRCSARRSRRCSPTGRAGSSSSRRPRTPRSAARRSAALRAEAL